MHTTKIYVYFMSGWSQAVSTSLYAGLAELSAGYSRVQILPESKLR